LVVSGHIGSAYFCSYIVNAKKFKNTIVGEVPPGTNVFLMWKTGRFFRNREFFTCRL